MKKAYQFLLREEEVDGGAVEVMRQAMLTERGQNCQGAG